VNAEADQVNRIQRLIAELLTEYSIPCDDSYVLAVGSMYVLGSAVRGYDPVELTKAIIEHVDGHSAHIEYMPIRRPS